MSKAVIAGVMLVAMNLAAFAGGDDDDDKTSKKSKMKFWNLTGVEVVELYLAPAGSTKFGANQTLNEDEKAVEPDERLPLTGLSPGKYDVKIKDKAGRSCLVKNIEIKDSGPYSFSLEADQLTDCTG